ncbi:uncharacterized protein B4U79_12004, partial [Dinothrombium tinctorium]
MTLLFQADHFDKTNDYSYFDKEIENHRKEFIRKTVENLIIDKTKSESKSIALPNVHSQSEQFFEGVDEKHADIHAINYTIVNIFSSQRNNFYNEKLKEEKRRTILQMFQNYGLMTDLQKFTKRTWFGTKLYDVAARNLIGILPSNTYGKQDDKIFVIGAHYDTVYRNPGVDDNGSGSAGVMEAARILSKYKEKINATIYFVLFDMEETVYYYCIIIIVLLLFAMIYYNLTSLQGCDGSKAFVKEYIIPKVIDKTNATYVGAFLIDMMLLFDPRENVQTLPEDIELLCPDSYKWLENNTFRGDFMSIWGRDADLFLYEALAETWKGPFSSHFKLHLIHSPLATNFNDLEPLHMYTTFFRSDHASFWSSAKYHKHIATLPTVLISDLGPWRGYQRKCYHKPCDNTIQLTEVNLNFMAHAIDSIVKAIFKLIGDEQKLKAYDN